MIATSINNEYRLRMAVVAVVIAAMGAWFVYDGAIGYPQKNKAHEVFAAKLGALEKVPTAAEWLADKDGDGVPFVERFARDEAGMKPSSSIMNAIKDTRARVEQIHQKEPDKAVAAQRAAEQEEALAKKMRDAPYNHTDIQTQFGFAIFAFAFAGLLLGVLAKRAATRIIAGDDAITRNGERFAYADLTAIDWGQWHAKHIVRMSFGNRALKLDGWHHARVDDIVALALKKRTDFKMPGKPASKEKE